MFIELTDTHFTMYVSNTIMLYILSLYSALCKLYLKKTGRRKAPLIVLACIQNNTWTPKLTLFFGKDAL